MKQITKTDLQNLYEPVPEKLRDEIEATLSALDRREERIVMKKKMPLALAAAIIILVLGMAALAVGKLDIFRFNEGVANPVIPLDGAEDMVETELGSVENELVTATVKEAIFDGQGTRLLVEITPKNPDEYVLFNAIFQDAPEELYETRNGPARVLNGEGNISIVNSDGQNEVYIDGEKVEVPGDAATALEKGIPVYMEDGKLYYAEQFEVVVEGRKDGKTMISYWVEANVADDAGNHLDGMYVDAEEQPDGSILVWLDGFSEAGVSDRAHVTVDVSVGEAESDCTLDDIEFTIDKNNIEKAVSLEPQGEIPGVEISSAHISFTKFRGYMIVDYIVDDKEETWFRLYDADGNEIAADGSTVRDLGNGRYRESFSMQAFEEIPERITLAMYRVGTEDELGRCECIVTAE